MKLLSVESDAKTIKGSKHGYLTGILYLAPADESGVANLCPKSTAGCRADCLYTAGMAGVFARINQARVAKTKWLVKDRAGFVAQLKLDIAELVVMARRRKMKPVVRVNGTSDLPQLARQMARAFPEVQFMDYTKIPRPWTRTMPNYNITFSHSEENESDCIAALKNGINVAVVFDTKKSELLPEFWNDRAVIDGDKNDLRFLDPKGVIVGLRAKGRARKDTESGFVVSTKNFVPLSSLAGEGVRAA